MVAADSEEGWQAIHGRNSSTTGAEMQRLPRRFASRPWTTVMDSAAEYVWARLFDKKQQFVTDEELVMGGSIQKLVCTYINICGGERARVFWEEKGGKESVLNTFCRKRQAAQNAMKLAFKGK
jgi:hypothetical protein